MDLFTFATFAFLIVACVEFAIIARLNQVLENHEQEYFILETERDTLREKVRSLQHENEDLEEKLEKAKKATPEKQENNVPKKRGRKPKAKKEDK